jgi:hypothetical protein
MVAGEGIIKWNVIDSSGATVTFKMPCFQIHVVDVRLLRPQVLLQLIGGQSVQIVIRICMLLGNKIILDAQFCLCRNLPFLQMGADGKRPRSF